MKKNIYLIFVSLGITLCLFSCKKDSITTGNVKPVVTLPDKITRDRTLKSDTVYTFSAVVLVTNGATLTIEPGTLIKSNDWVNGTVNGKGRSGYIAIDRGAKIMAVGTPDKPIVFTSGSPSGQRQFGDWAGLYIMGNAPVSAYDDATGGAGTEIQLKNLSAVFPFGGGNNPADNSGVLKYVRIEFAGIVGSDSYGLACVGVGSGTVIENVEASYTQTSGFGFYGGTVNARNLVAFNNRQTGFVYANGFKGKQQFLVSYKHPYFAAPGMFIYTCDGVLVLNDIQNNPLVESTRPVLSNLTVIGPYNNPGYNDALPWNAAVNIYYGSALSLRNSVVMGMPHGGIKFGDDAAAQHLLDGSTEFSYNLAHSNRPGEAFTTDMNNVFSIDSTFVNTYAFGHNNSRYDTPLEISLADPFNFSTPGLLPKSGSPALTGANFSGTDYSSFFKAVNYRGAFGTDNWMKSWTNFYPVTTDY
jgi:hypothetical protein